MVKRREICELLGVEECRCSSAAQQRSQRSSQRRPKKVTKKPQKARNITPNLSKNHSKTTTKRTTHTKDPTANTKKITPKHQKTVPKKQISNSEAALFTPSPADYQGPASRSLRRRTKVPGRIRLKIWPFGGFWS